MPLECPNPNKSPYDLKTLLAKLDENKNNFAEDFAITLLAANRNNPDAIACVESYLYPSNQELQDFGINRSQWDPMRKCTDVGTLVLAKCQEKAPQVFAEKEAPKGSK